MAESKRVLNNYFFENDICKIEINSKKHGLIFALIDSEDYHKIKHLKWVIDGRGYVTSKIGPRKRLMSYKLHRVVMNCDSNFHVDHILHDKLDNRKSRLRICTHKENLRNQVLQNRVGGKSSRFKGVSWDKSRNKWTAKIRVDQKTINLGRTISEVEAAKKYDLAAIKYFGEYALLNNYEVGTV